jgi:hypothetical protein
VATTLDPRESSFRRRPHRIDCNYRAKWLLFSSSSAGTPRTESPCILKTRGTNRNSPRNKQSSAEQRQCNRRRAAAGKAARAGAICGAHHGVVTRRGDKVTRRTTRLPTSGLGENRRKDGVLFPARSGHGVEQVRCGGAGAVRHREGRPLRDLATQAVILAESAAAAGWLTFGFRIGREHPAKD